MPNCVVLFCGLPGSGKTSLIKEFSENVVSKKDTRLTKNCEHLGLLKQEVHDSGKYEIHVISYDQLVPLKLQEKLVELEGWKTNRQQILRASEAYICYACHIPEMDFITQSLQPIETSHLENIKISNRSRMNPVVSENRCFLVEDNFYYRSMRYEWFQLARKYGLGFCQVYLDCTTTTAVQRNCKRCTQVPETVIKRMAVRAEKPDKENSNWEKHSILIDTELDFCRDLGVIFELVDEALSHPEQPFDDKSQEKLKSRQNCSQNILHQVDLILRKLVARKIQAVKDEPSQLLNQVSKELNSLKQSMLNKLRNGEINFPKGLLETLQNSDVPVCQNQDLQNFVTEHFGLRTQTVVNHLEDNATS